MDSFNEFWNKKEEELRSEGQKIERDLSDRHQE